jgi:hypothetical protein
MLISLDQDGPSDSRLEWNNIKLTSKKNISMNGNSKMNLSRKDILLSRKRLTTMKIQIKKI